MSEKLRKESAFACTAQLNDGEAIYEPGMSKRFYAACAAMQGILSNQILVNKYAGRKAEIPLIKDAYEFADELLKQENDGS